MSSRKQPFAHDWQSQMALLFKNLMGTCRIRDIEDLDQRIGSLGAECTRLEEDEKCAWERLQAIDHFSALTSVQTNRKLKDWNMASTQLGWALRSLEKLAENSDSCSAISSFPQADSCSAISSFPQVDTNSCAALWKKLDEKHRERAELVNLRCFYEDIESSMNLDNRFDMGNWELVKGGDTGFNVSPSKGLGVGVFIAKGSDGKAYAIKCARPDGNSPEEIRSMKREVDSISMLLHPCVLQYTGDYTLSSSHFLKFTLKSATKMIEAPLCLFLNLFALFFAPLNEEFQ